ncbi:MAG: type II toxin-antitoxin system RelE/ParE family toxin [Paramuribaculum sp.]|nr:type II toxin-antitoxin system RelE/ParE family toxin [Paramuribaculum sp.]
MEIKAKFDIIYMADAIDFLDSLPEKARDKIAFNISKSRYFVDKDLFKKLNENIWEFRTRFQNTTYRLLAFWDNGSGSLVVATHGFIKKTQKTPANELSKAETLRKQYFTTKQNQNN